MAQRIQFWRSCKRGEKMTLNEQLRVDGSAFEVDKGCTFELDIEIQNSDGSTFEPANDSKVIFTAKKKNASTAAITQELEKYENVAKYNLLLTAAQTAALTTGRYNFDVVYTEDNDTVYKVIPTSMLIINDTISNGRIWT